MASKKRLTGDRLPQTNRISSARTAKVLASSATVLADFAAQALAAAEDLRIASKPLERFWLAPAQRDVLRGISGLRKSIKSKLAKETSRFTVAEVVKMAQTLAESLPDYETQQSVGALVLGMHLIERLNEGIVDAAAPKRRRGRQPNVAAGADAVLQFKITLMDSNPPVWRRIQVEDCTLDTFHAYIQMAMGWTNSHLHQFEIRGERYADPELLDNGFDDFDCIDSTRTRLSQILPARDRQFRFLYEYDFGDSWKHEVLFEGRSAPQPGRKYPLCLEGERACPPEDVGGVWGYHEFVLALADSSHERHEEYMEWAGDFVPDRFDANKATKAMRRGRPDWSE